MIKIPFGIKKKKEGGIEEKKTVEMEKKTAGEREFEEGLVSVRDIIAPAALEVDFNHLRINNGFYRTLFISGYPAFVTTNWLSSLINFDHPLSVSMYIYPAEGKKVLDDLRRKIAEMEAELSTDMQRGKVVNPGTQAKLEDALKLQEELVKGEERFFQFGLYVAISAKSLKELDQVTSQLEAALGALLIISKKATLQMEEAFQTCLPVCNDQLNITRNMDTTALATTFPFVSSDLSDDKGIMYGINQHNGSLVIFDRFSMENYNSVVFAKAGAGKSYLVKLEVLRSLMMETEVIVIDPENEYETLCEAVGGQYIAFGFDEKSKINPFDLSMAEEEGENELQRKILSLHGLFKVIMGQLNPEEEAMLDRALVAAYKMKGITPDPETQIGKEAPLIEDLYKSLIGMEDPKAQSLAARLEKFIKGSFAGIFNNQSTVNLKNKLVVFGIKNLEEALRPVAMYIILDYIWTRVRKDIKKRILVVDEAWYLMQHPDSALFLYGMAKRARKYFLAVTTITQDVEDFLGTNQGKAIVTNSSIQILLKQHTAAIEKVSDVFYLSEGEKQLLLAAAVGEGIFFAGQSHVAIRIVASPEEHELITSDPAELLKRKETKEAAQNTFLNKGKFFDEEEEKAQKGKEKAREEEEMAVKIEPAIDPIVKPIPEPELILEPEPIPEPMAELKTEEWGNIGMTEKEAEEEEEVGEAESSLSERVAQLEQLENKKLEEAEKEIKKEGENKKLEEERIRKEEEERKKKMYGGWGSFGESTGQGGSFWPKTVGTNKAIETGKEEKTLPETEEPMEEKKGVVNPPGPGWAKAKTEERSFSKKKPEVVGKNGKKVKEEEAPDYQSMAKKVWGGDSKGQKGPSDEEEENKPLNYDDVLG